MTSPRTCSTTQLIALALLFALGPGLSAAQTSIDRAFAPSPRDCADVRWSAEVLQSIPSIAQACQAVEERNGKSYVKFEGAVQEVRNRGKRVRVDFEDGSELMFTPTPRTALYIDGKRTPFGELDEGMELNFYIPEDRLQAELQPDPARIAFIIVPIEITPAPLTSDRSSMTAMNRSDELPQTAGVLPVLGAAGILLIAAGAVTTLTRKLRVHR